MDLSADFSFSESSPLHLEHPITGEPLGAPASKDNETDTRVIIDLASGDSSTHQKAFHRLANMRIEKAKGFRNPVVTVEKAEKEGIELLASCTLGWKNIELDGEVLPFSKENAIKLYSKVKWVREQVDSFIGNRKNFLVRA